MCIECITTDELLTHAILQKKYIESQSDVEKIKLTSNNKNLPKPEKKEDIDDYKQIMVLNIEPISKWNQDKIYLYLSRYLSDLRYRYIDVLFLLNEYKKYILKTKDKKKIQMYDNYLRSIKETNRDNLAQRIFNVN